MGWKARDIPDLTGRTAVVTGGNGGLGLVTSLRLAQHGARVVIGARNMARGEAARLAIQRHVPGSTVEVGSLDLGSLAAIERFATEVVAAHPVIDLLFDNAGVMAVPEGRTADGFETQFGTNHLGHFALTMRLLPAIAGAAAGRVVVTTSTARFTAGSYDLTNPHLRGCYDPWRAYGTSKRANLQFALELNRRLEGTSITAYAGDPGFSKTGLQRTAADAMDGLQHRFWRVAVRHFGQPASVGALPQLRAGTDPEALGGTLYTPRFIAWGAPVVRGVSPALHRPEELEELWALSERETGLRLPELA